MAQKRANAPKSKVQSALPKGAVKKQTLENKYPQVLAGRPLQQLQLPNSLLEAAQKRRIGPAAAPLPSNIAEIRAALKARKLKLG